MPGSNSGHLSGHPRLPRSWRKAGEAVERIRSPLKTLREEYTRTAECLSFPCKLHCVCVFHSNFHRIETHECPVQILSAFILTVSHLNVPEQPKSLTYSITVLMPPKNCNPLCRRQKGCEMPRRSLRRADVGGRDWHAVQLSESRQRIISSVCVCVLFDSVRQTELEPAARHTQHTPPLDKLHTMLLLLSLSEDGGYAGLEGMSCAFSFFLSLSHTSRAQG